MPVSRVTFSAATQRRSRFLQSLHLDADESVKLPFHESDIHAWVQGAVDAELALWRVLKVCTVCPDYRMLCAKVQRSPTRQTCSLHSPTAIAT